MWYTLRPWKQGKEHEEEEEEKEGMFSSQHVRVEMESVSLHRTAAAKLGMRL